MLHLSSHLLRPPRSTCGQKNPCHVDFASIIPLRQSQEGTCPISRDFRETPPTNSAASHQDRLCIPTKALERTFPRLPNSRPFVNTYFAYSTKFTRLSLSAFTQAQADRRPRNPIKGPKRLNQPFGTREQPEPPRSRPTRFGESEPQMPTRDGRHGPSGDSGLLARPRPAQHDRCAAAELLTTAWSTSASALPAEKVCPDGWTIGPLNLRVPGPAFAPAIQRANAP